VAITLTDYFTCKAETPQMKIVARGEELNLFHDYELAHLQDVKKLFQVARRVQAASIAYIIIYALLFLLWRKGPWQDLITGVKRGSIITLGSIVVLGILSFLGFQQLFIAFHYLIFGDPSQSFWILDPGKDYLIMLFPEPFWQNSAIFGGIAIAAGALLMGGIAWLILHIHQGRRNTKQQN